MLEWDADEQVWVSYVPTLGQLSTHGDTRDEALEQTREAILGYLEAAVKEGIPIPRADTETEIMGAMRSSSRIEFWRWFAHRERKWSCRESNPGPSTPG